MTTLIVILSIIGYLLVGSVVAGLIERIWSSLYDFSDWALIILFWPFLVAAGMIGAIVYPFAYLGSRIGD